MSEKIELMVVVDMQNDFVSGSLGGDMARAIVPNVAAAVDKFIAENGAGNLLQGMPVTVKIVPAEQ